MLKETERVKLYDQNFWPTEMRDKLPRGKRAGVAPIAFRHRIVIDIILAGGTEKRGYVTVIWEGAYRYCRVECEERGAFARCSVKQRVGFTDAINIREVAGHLRVSRIRVEI